MPLGSGGVVRVPTCSWSRPTSRLGREAGRGVGASEGRQELTARRGELIIPHHSTKETYPRGLDTTRGLG